MKNFNTKINTTNILFFELFIKPVNKELENHKSYSMKSIKFM